MGSLLSEQENRNLARVAQFYGVTQESVRDARVQYDLVIKRLLLEIASNNVEVDAEYMARISQDLDRTSFSEIARNLGYPKFGNPTRNLLRLLAELPLPIFITTCQHAFLELALSQTGFKEPRTEIFYWDDSLHDIESVYDSDPQYRPSVEKPLVYHLFGIDEYPNSLVLTEDDYLSILMRLSELKRDVKVGGSGGAGADAKHDIPSDVKLAFSNKGLLLLGYAVDDWEFRVLFRWLFRYIGQSRFGRPVPKAICLQLEPSLEGEHRNTGIKKYLERFFHQHLFSVYWGDPADCVHDLWSRWKGG